MEAECTIEMEGGDFCVMALEIHEVKMIRMSLMSTSKPHRLE